MAQFSLADASNLFKIKYGKLSENTYNSANVLLARAKKTYDFVGKQHSRAVPISMSGGVGSGSLPTANFSDIGDAQLIAKKMYAVIQIEREAVKAASNNEGAFVEMTKFSVQKGVESWMRNMSRALFSDGSGALGTIAAGGVSGTGPWDCVISAATWKEANFEEKDYVNLTGAIGVKLEVTAVDPATRTVTLSAVAGGGSYTPVAGDVIYMQGSQGADPQGLKGVLTPDVSVTSLYGINIQRRWQGTELAAGGSGLTTDLMNQQMLEIQRKCGKVPNLIITSYTQFRKLLNVLEDQKQYIVEPRSPELVGKVSFRGVEFMSSAGPVGVFPERFCEDDRMYMLNDNFIEIAHRPDFGWFDDDGTVFLRDASSDSYSARFGGYLQSYIAPSFHGVITGLAT